MGLLNYHQTGLPSFLMDLFAVLGMGLAAGAGARAAFYVSPGFVKFLSMLFVLPVGLFLLGILSNWQMGIGPLDPWLAGGIDWYQLARLGGAFLVAVLALEAWLKPASYSVPEPDARRSSDYDEHARRPASWQAVSRSSQPQAREVHPSVPRRNVRLKMGTRASAYSRTSPEDGKIVLSHKTSHSRSRHRKLSRRKPNLQISHVEEHRCPYCLDEVKRNDPRGVKKCSVCNAVHHADCWDITGSCQVPHLNT
jgi:ribosomal protein L37AE/L43A